VDRPPSVDELARSLPNCDLPHAVLVEVARSAIKDGTHDRFPALVEQRRLRLLGPVINATGVLLHTNMGRAPLAHQTEAQYSNLELDLTTGQRGSRQRAVGELLATAAGAPAAMVVNNCAGAVMLALAAVAAGGPVAVSRGELVEIGGAFRVPDVMAWSGAQLVEVGTTNRTRLNDYRAAVEQHGAVAVLKVHQSNYRIVGFTEETTVQALASLDVPVIADIGSGLVDASCPWLEGKPPVWLEGEPAARQTLKAGADLITFSGDKLFGGPQAGIIAGRSDLVQRCQRHPLTRALRPGGLVLSALQETALAYLNRDGARIPFWQMASIRLADLEQRATQILSLATAEASARGLRPPTMELSTTEAVPGGGTLPTVTIESRGIRLLGNHVDALRQRTIPIIARVEDGGTVLDVRTITPHSDEYVAAALGTLGDEASP